MNLTKFLKLVDEQIGKMTAEETEKFLHEYARTLLENQREEFLKKVKRGATAGREQKEYAE